MVSERQRQWAPKVRTGCFTCKKRKKRCDETRPVCRRCRKGGYICDGYETSNLRSCTVQKGSGMIAELDRAALEFANRSINEQNHNSLTPDLLHGGHLNFIYLTSDHRCTQFFVARVAPVLASTRQWQTFWEDTIPLTSINENPIHHAMLALSSAYEGKFLNIDRDRTTEHQISQAIQTSMVGRMSINSILILCRLLAAVSQSAGDWMSAMIHLQHGWRVLLEAMQSDEADLSLAELLGPIFLCASTRAVTSLDDALNIAGSDQYSIAKLDKIRSTFAAGLSALNWRTIDSSMVRTSIMLCWTNMTRALYALICSSLSNEVSVPEPGTIPISILSLRTRADDGILNFDRLQSETKLLMYELKESLEQLRGRSALSFQFTERLLHLTENFMVNAFVLDPNADVGMFWSEHRETVCDIDVHLLRLKEDSSNCQSCFNDGQLSARLQMERRNQENYLEYICPYRSGFLPAFRSPDDNLSHFRCFETDTSKSMKYSGRQYDPSMARVRNI